MPEDNDTRREDRDEPPAEPGLVIFGPDGEIWVVPEDDLVQYQVPSDRRAEANVRSVHDYEEAGAPELKAFEVAVSERPVIGPLHFVHHHT